MGKCRITIDQFLCSLFCIWLSVLSYLVQQSVEEEKTIAVDDKVDDENVAEEAIEDDGQITSVVNKKDDDSPMIPSGDHNAMVIDNALDKQEAEEEFVLNPEEEIAELEKEASVPIESLLADYLARCAAADEAGGDAMSDTGATDADELSESDLSSTSASNDDSASSSDGDDESSDSSETVGEDCTLKALLSSPTCAEIKPQTDTNAPADTPAETPEGIAVQPLSAGANADEENLEVGLSEAVN